MAWSVIGTVAAANMAGRIVCAMASFGSAIFLTCFGSAICLAHLRCAVGLTISLTIGLPIFSTDVAGGIIGTLPRHRAGREG